MTNSWLLDTVDADSPIAHWRLGEPSSGVTRHRIDR